MFVLCMDIFKNLNVYSSSGVLMDSNSLSNMFSLEDVILTFDILQGLQYLYSTHCNYEAIPNFLCLRKLYCGINNL